MNIAKVASWSIRESKQSLRFNHVCWNPQIKTSFRLLYRLILDVHTEREACLVSDWLDFTANREGTLRD